MLIMVSLIVVPNIKLVKLAIQSNLIYAMPAGRLTTKIGKNLVEPVQIGEWLGIIVITI